MVKELYDEGEDAEDSILRPGKELDKIRFGFDPAHHLAKRDGKVTQVLMI